MTTPNQPRITINLANAAQIVSNSEQRVLIVGQKTATGSATGAGEIVEQIDNSGQEDDLFGARSQLAGMIRGYKTANQATRVDALVLSDSGSSKAEGVFTIDVATTPNLTNTVAAASSVSRSVTTATFNTITNHGFIAGDHVTITGADDDDYNLSDVTIALGDLDTFTYTVDGGAVTPDPSSTTQVVRVKNSIASIVEAGGITTVTYTTAHTYSAGDLVELEGANEAGFVGVFTILSVATLTFTCVTNGTGTATGTLLSSLNSSVDGTLTFDVASSRNYTFEVAVSEGDTPTFIADKLVAATTSAPQMPYTVSNVTGVVTFVAANAGTVANREAFQISGSVFGVTVALSSSVGSVDPTLTNILTTAAADIRYQGIVWPYSDTTELQTFLDARFNPTGTILDGIGFVSFVGSSTEVATQIDENSESIVYFNDDFETTTTLIGASQVELTYVVTATFAGIRALRLDTSGQSLADVVITTFGALDAFGGASLASKPYFNTPFANVDVNSVGLGYTDQEIEDILDIGGSIFGNNSAQSAVITGEIVTTYLTTAVGIDDDTFKFLNFVDTASQIREFYFNNYKNRFGQTRLTEGDTQVGRDMANEATIAAFTVQLYQELADLALIQDGKEALDFFLENLIIVLDLSDGTVAIQMKVPIVTQLRTINATIQIAFSTTS